jgi:ribulose kinase
VRATMAAAHFVGVDGGTESIRAGVFTLQGAPRASRGCARARDAAPAPHAA